MLLLFTFSIVNIIYIENKEEHMATSIESRYLNTDPTDPKGIHAESLRYSSSLSIKEAIDNSSGGVLKKGTPYRTTTVVPADHFMIACQGYHVDGELIVDGDLIEI